MQSHNKYKGIDTYALACVRHNARTLVTQHPCFTVDDYEDIEQELVLYFITESPKFDPTKSSWRLPRPEFEDLLEQAACRGARKALHEVGLNDEGAATDVRDLRDLLSAVRTAKTEALRAIVRWFTVGMLLLIMAGIAAKSGYYFTTK